MLKQQTARRPPPSTAATSSCQSSFTLRPSKEQNMQIRRRPSPAPITDTILRIQRTRCRQRHFLFKSSLALRSIQHLQQADFYLKQRIKPIKPVRDACWGASGWSLWPPLSFGCLWCSFTKTQLSRSEWKLVLVRKIDLQTNYRSKKNCFLKCKKA